MTEHDNENGPCACGAWHRPGDAGIVGGRWTPCAFDANPDRRVPRWPESAGVGPGEHRIGCNEPREHAAPSGCSRQPCVNSCSVCTAPCRAGEIRHGRGCFAHSEDGGGIEDCDECEVSEERERIAFLEAELAEARLATDRWMKQATDAEQELASDREWYEGELTSARLTASEAIDERDAVMADRDRWVERVKTLEAKLASVREVVR